eukprot:Blabericola_migrator_1__2713@NODE_1771_length_3818_cov_18_925620_g1143_i0_p4_GENE_NODE_1771_length_3818_cov_18_925620_g1143_i0NODE_1771_length_3818_cov_18_925620_g1143_i0_p4_ORF_typecomplete_len114_score12_91_NODE_1771_length_3818_cov_18_925620_g1143_i033993740
MPQYVRAEPRNFREYAQGWRDVGTADNLKAAAGTTAAGALHAGGKLVHGVSNWLGNEASRAQNKAMGPEWNQSAGPYEPYCWKQYRKGGYEYDLVAYRRRRRSCLERVLCCGA